MDNAKRYAAATSLAALAGPITHFENAKSVARLEKRYYTDLLKNNWRNGISSSQWNVRDNGQVHETQTVPPYWRIQLEPDTVPRSTSGIKTGLKQARRSHALYQGSLQDYLGATHDPAVTLALSARGGASQRRARATRKRKTPRRAVKKNTRRIAKR